ncbi:hypothetical protein ES703_22463 [subsurface metagenome]
MGTLNLQVTVDTDDCYRVPPPTDAFTYAANDNAVGDYVSTAYDYSIGLRFLLVDIPEGATIDVAFLTLRAYGGIDGSIPPTVIEGEDKDDPITFSTKEDYDARVKTGANVAWTPAAWVTDTWYDSHSLVSVIQEIIDRPGWLANNSLVLFWRDRDAGWQYERRIFARDYHASPALAAKLHIEYSPAVIAPAVTTEPATSVEEYAATLNGTLDDDGGEACDCGFEWGETDAYGNDTPTQSRTTGQTFAQTISGLDPNQTYHFRSVATNGAGTTYGADRSFTTLVALSSVTTDPATGVGKEAATLNGTLDDDGGQVCDCGFEWGKTDAYGNATPTQSRTTGQTFAQTISGLDPNQTYHFRAMSTNDAV